jgi:CDP-glycerol glycerophosphotransferase (TagB/SpsB family)/glycosyltransferase involved in cell wall biosynthesis
MTKEISSDEHPTFSVITPAYNVDRYIEEYFASLFNQTADAALFEILIIDDGSTDRTGAIAQEWAARHPQTVRYFRKPNGGLSSARNFGLGHARGKWLTFIDPDDFVDKNYFKEVSRFVAEYHAECPLISCNLILFYEDSRRISDSHPLKYRFAKGKRVVNLIENPDCFQLSIASAFVRADLVRKFDLRFDSRVTPSFEDAKFIAELLLRSGDFRIGFVPQAQYYYRKRSDNSSLVTSGMRRLEAYKERIEFGYLDTLLIYHRALGRVETFVQNLILYDLGWYFKRFYDRDRDLHFLTEKESAEFEALVFKIFEHIDTETVQNYDPKLLGDRHKTGILARYRGHHIPATKATVGVIDTRRKLVCIQFYDNSTSAVRFFVDGSPRKEAFSKTLIHRFNRRPYVSERFFWLPLRESEQFEIIHEDRVMRLDAAGTRAYKFEYSNIVRLTETRSNRIKLLRRVLRWISKTAIVRALYGGAWLFIDRDVQADDNAEHLFRWVTANTSQSRKCFFVLRRSSHDWKRLKRDGFRLVRFGSLRHALIYLNAAWLISSHADEYIVDFLPAKKYGSSARGYAFLQHGITKDDLSRWLNSKQIDLFVTSARVENESVVQGPYKFSEREVCLAGLARHDRLLSKSSQPNFIVVMPTWRQALVGPSTKKGNMRAPNDRFLTSRYKEAWESIVGDFRLAERAKQLGYEIIFFPHANMQMYLDEFQVADNVRSVGHRDCLIQDLFSHCALLITDFSSVAFEIALLKRPVLYFQFDKDEYFPEQPYDEGYFDYERDGFGEVCRDHDTIATLICQYMADGCNMKSIYSARADEFFEHRDGENCRRTYEAILERSRPFEPAKGPSMSMEVPCSPKAS